MQRVISRNALPLHRMLDSAFYIVAHRDCEQFGSHKPLSPVYCFFCSAHGLFHTRVHGGEITQKIAFDESVNLTSLRWSSPYGEERIHNQGCCASVSPFLGDAKITMQIAQHARCLQTNETTAHTATPLQVYIVCRCFSGVTIIGTVFGAPVACFGTHVCPSENVQSIAMTNTSDHRRSSR